MFLWLLACTTEPLPGSDRPFARIDAGHHDPTLAQEVGPLGPRRWATEEAVGECRMYGDGGELLSWTTITAAGLPLVRQTTSGNRFTWTRRYRSDGTLAETWVYRRLAGQSQELLVHEGHDAAGRLVSRNGDEATWEYDSLGRLAASVTITPTTRHTKTWAYDDDGRVTHTTTRTEWDGYLDKSATYGWESGRLVLTRRKNDDNSSLTTWVSWHPSGSPERGDVVGWNWLGDADPTTELWTYDADGRPLTWAGPDGVIGTWEWDHGRLVRQQVYDRVQEWDWDESDRLIYRDDGEYDQWWSWDDDGDLAGTGWGEHAYIYEGDCPPSLFELPEVPTPGPLPVEPQPPRPYGG